MEFWVLWTRIVLGFRGAFSRQRTFLIFAIILAGFALRGDQAGVSTFVRSFGLQSKFYDRFLRLFRSTAVKLEKLLEAWVRILTLPVMGAFHFKGRRILLLDGVQTQKSGNRMPAVTSLCNTASDPGLSTFYRGHFFQAIALLVGTCDRLTAVPVTAQIHQGLKLSPHDRKTLLHKAVALIGTLAFGDLYVVADAYYGNGAFLRGLVDLGHHVITRIKQNSVAYLYPPERLPGQRGRPRKLGPKVLLRDMFLRREDFTTCTLALYGKLTTVQYLTQDLICKSFGGLVRYVLVIYPDGNRVILMTTDLSCAAKDVIRLYSFRFRIEGMFRQTKQVLGSFFYHFWTRSWEKRKSGKTRYLHRTPEKQRRAILKTFRAYGIFVQCAFLAHGIMRLLSHHFPTQVWDSFGGWMRTIKVGLSPSEAVVRNALQSTYAGYFANHHETVEWLKILYENLDHKRKPAYQYAKTG